MTGPTRRQYAHRLTTNEKIMQVMQNNAGKWLSSNEIAMQMHMSFSRGVGRRLNYLHVEIPELEMIVDEHTHNRHFRYNRSGGTAE